MICDIKALRLIFGLTQVEFAVQSGISLPTLQNIEAGKANPSLDILEKVVSTLGLELKAEAPFFDIHKAMILGVALVSNKMLPKIKPSRVLLKQEARKWMHYFRNETFSEREMHAVTAFLCALKDHWPTSYKEVECQVFNEKINLLFRNGHVIKLRRISLSNLSKYL